MDLSYTRALANALGLGDWNQLGTGTAQAIPETEILRRDGGTSVRGAVFLQGNIA